MRQGVKHEPVSPSNLKGLEHAQKQLVRVKFTNNPYSYRTHIDVNGRAPLKYLHRVTTLQTRWNSLTFPWQCAALMPMLSATHSMPVVLVVM